MQQVADGGEVERQAYGEIGRSFAGFRDVASGRQIERCGKHLTCGIADGLCAHLQPFFSLQDQADQIANAVRQGLARFGQIDVLINNAGQGLYAAVEEIEAAEFRALLELNLIAPLMMMQAVIPPMRRQGAGRIINVSSGATLATYPGAAAYTSSKAGLNMLSGVARLELAEAGITVSTVYPFMTASEFYQSVKSGQEAAIAQAEQSAAFAHAPERVAEKILAIVESGEAQGDLVPRAWGGTCDD